jgi:hypothetical protein
VSAAEVQDRSPRKDYKTASKIDEKAAEGSIQMGDAGGSSEFLR